MNEPLEPRRVAALEESRIGVGVAEVADESLAWCGGVACCSGPGSWANQALNCGMGGETVTTEDAMALGAWYEARGCEPKIQVVPFADPSLARSLGEAGFILREFEMVFACDVRERTPGGWSMPEGVTFEDLDPDDEELLEASVRLATPIYAPDGDPPQAMVDSFRAMARHPRMRTILVRADGVLVASSGLEIAGEIASLCGAAVVPEQRRRGIQRALIEARLDAAARAGCEVVTVTSLPGIPTERNAMRAGFGPSYTKVALVRPGEGLVASP